MKPLLPLLFHLVVQFLFFLLSLFNKFLKKKEFYFNLIFVTYSECFFLLITCKSRSSSSRCLASRICCALRISSRAFILAGFMSGNAGNRCICEGSLRL